MRQYAFYAETQLPVIILSVLINIKEKLSKKNPAVKKILKKKTTQGQSAMAEAELPVTEIPCNSLEGNLPDVVASLEMLTVASTSCNSPQSVTKRTLRKRIPKADMITEVRNRRCSLRPKKRSAAAMESEDDVKDYYLDRNVRRKPNNLETIYEEMDDKPESTTIAISSRRFKRLIQFETKASDAKIKKRRAKIKKVFGSKVKLRNGLTSMQTLINKLNSIRTESPTKITDSNLQLPKVFECLR